MTESNGSNGFVQGETAGIPDALAEQLGIKPRSPGQAALADAQQRNPGQTGPDTLANPDSGVPSGASLEDMDRTGALARFRSAMLLSPHVSKIGDAIHKTITENPKAAAQPGGVMRAVVAGGLQAITGIGASLGDAAAVGTVPEGGGALTGMARTMGARNQRMREQRQDAQTKEKDNALIAETNMRTRHTQALLHQLDDEVKDKLIASNQPVLQTLREAGADYVIGENKDSSELAQDIQNKKIKPTQHAGILTGKKGSGDGLSRGTYSIVIPHDVDLDPSNPNQKKVLDLLNQYAPPANGKTWNGDSGGAIHFQGDQFLHLVATANENQVGQEARKRILADNEIKDNQQSEQLEAYRSKPEIMNALAHNNMNPMAAYQALVGSGKFPNAAKDMAAYFGDQEWKEMFSKAQTQFSGGLDLDKLQKDLNEATGSKIASIQGTIESAMKTASPEMLPKLQKMLDQANTEKEADLNYEEDKESRKKAEKEGFKGDENLSGEAYIQTLKPGEKNIVRGIGTGHITVERMGYLATRNPNLLNAVQTAFPEFDSAKAEAYPATYKSFTSGDVSKKLKAGAVALDHLKKLYDHTTGWSLVPGSKDNKDRQADVTQAAEEIAFFQKGGGAAPSKEEVEHMREVLDPINPINRRESIKEQVRLMRDNLNEFKETWQNAAPSKYYQAPMPWISQNAWNNAEHVLNDGKSDNKQPESKQPPRPGQPANTVYMKKPDGTYMYAPQDKVQQYQKAGASLVQ